MGAVDRRLVAHSRVVRRFLALSVVLSVVAVVLLILQAYALATAINGVFLDGKTLDEVRSAVVLLLVAVVCRSAVVWLQEWTARRSSLGVAAELRGRLTRSLAHRDPDSRQGAAELATVMTRGVDSLEGYVTRYLPQVAVAVVVPLVVLVQIGIVDWVSGLVLLITLPLIPVFMALVGWTTQRETNRRWRTLGVLSGHFLDVIQGLTTLRIFGRADAQVASIRTTSEDYRRATGKTLRVAFLSSFVLELLTTLSLAVVAVGIGLRLVDGRLDLTTGLFVLILAPEAYLPLRNLGAAFHSSAEGVTAADQIAPLLETTAPDREATTITPPRRGAITIDRVEVTYDGRTEPALPASSFVLAPGRLVVLVGASGAGKSTLLSVLSGRRLPDAGTVRAGDVERRDVEADAWRAQVAWAGQRARLFAGTVADNIRLGDPEADDEQVRLALRAAAAQFVYQLPQGLLTPIANDGAGLSAGQRQRIALARFHLRVARLDPHLLLLDEPTAHLDADSEQAVVVGLLGAVQDRCALVVSHRRRVISAADEVLHLTSSGLAIAQPNLASSR